MADADVQITAGSGTKIDTRTVGTGTDEHRQVVVIGDPSTAANVASVDATYGLGVDLDRWAPHVVPGTLVNKTAQYTSTQNGVALWTPASGKRIVVTSLQIQVGGTTAGTNQVWFGASGDTSYGRGTDAAIFDGEWAPSSTLKPGVVITPTVPWVGTTDYILRVTTSASINPLTVTVWGYEV